ncbi:MAG: tetratricopeptide repeat protein [Spirochaetota bacterium]|nr:tetratricopeptide repeat protein [Spirochaetota bacterium]
MPNQIISFTDENTYLTLGKRFYEKKKYIKALEHLKRALKLNNQFIEAHLLLVEIYQSLNDLSQALVHFEEAVFLGKNDWQSKRQLIKLYLTENHYPKALELIKQRLHWLKGDLSLWIRLKAFVFKDKKIYDELEKVLFQITYLYREEEKFKLAIKFGKKLIRIKSDSISHYLLATIYEAKNCFTMAQKEFSKATKDHTQITAQFYEQVYLKIKENQLIPQVSGF